MRAFRKRTAILAAIGFALGLLVGLCFLAHSGSREYYAHHGPGRLALYLALSGALGAVNVGTTTIYSLERWGLLRCTLTHFLIAMTTYCMVGFVLGWLSLGEPATLWMLAVCTVVYFIVWLVMYLIYKRQIRRINAALQRWKSERADE